MARLFAAISLPEDAQVALQSLHTPVDGARFAPEGGHHLTLRFFGEASEPRAAALEARLAELVFAPLTVELAGVGRFGHPPRVLWAGVAESSALHALASSIEGAARALGWAAEDRDFHPHVTIARLKRTSPIKARAWVQEHHAFRAPPFVVSSFGLFESELDAQRARHRLRRSFEATREASRR